MCDDMGFSDVGSYGGEIDTPNIDRLAADGLRFRNFYNNAKCEHTRASLLTGRWWHHVGASPTVTYADQTFAERLRPAGYQTFMTGKWHAGQNPTTRGFERYYGLTDGCCNFWNPGVAIGDAPEPARKKIRRWSIDGHDMLPYTPDQDGFYTTDAFTDAAIGYVDAADRDRPMLLYVAYTAPHYPLHASQSDVAKYRGRYTGGWDALRRERFTRQRSLGVLPPSTRLSPRDPDLIAWDDVADSDRDRWDLRMATYAAMIDRMDRNIGRLLDSIRRRGRFDNTLVLFFSDNGACEDSRDRSTRAGAMPWEVESYLTQGRNWANASNTPYRKYKTTNYEGGTRSPLIAHWPAVVTAPRWTDAVSHLVDITPTLLELADAPEMPDPAGVSLVDVLTGNPADNDSQNAHASDAAPSRPPLFWKFNRSEAMRSGDWKIVRTRASEPRKNGRGHNHPWQLYNLADDPTELDDVAAAHPDRLESMADQWQRWWNSPSVSNEAPR